MSVFVVYADSLTGETLVDKKRRPEGIEQEIQEVIQA